MSDEVREYEPPWGADGWPRMTETGLDEADCLLVASMLQLTPRERLDRLRDFVNGLERMRRAARIRPE